MTIEQEISEARRPMNDWQVLGRSQARRAPRDPHISKRTFTLAYELAAGAKFVRAGLASQ